jgi:hypothetical protein
MMIIENITTFAGAGLAYLQLTAIATRMAGTDKRLAVTAWLVLVPLSPLSGTNLTIY